MLDSQVNQFRVEQTEISSRTKSRTQIKLAKFELIQALACYCLAALCVAGGVILIGLGATGEIALAVEHAGWKATFINLSPGAFIFLVGVGFAWFGRYRFRHTT